MNLAATINVLTAAIPKAVTTVIHGISNIGPATLMAKRIRSQNRFYIIGMCMCFTTIMSSRRLKISNIKNGKKKIQTMSTKCQYNQSVLLFGDCNFSNIKRNHAHDNHSSDDMEGMEPRCCKIKGPENIFSQSYPTINFG